MSPTAPSPTAQRPKPQWRFVVDGPASVGFGPRTQVRRSSDDVLLGWVRRREDEVGGWQVYDAEGREACHADLRGTAANFLLSLFERSSIA